MTKNNCVIDSYAWIEYFRGSGKGRMASPYIEGGEGLTPLVVVAELSAYYARRNLPHWEEDFRFIEAQTALAEMPLSVAKIAGRTRERMRRERENFGLVDAIVYETALHHKALVVSGDPHFEGLPQVVFLRE